MSSIKREYKPVNQIETAFVNKERELKMLEEKMETEYPARFYQENSLPSEVPGGESNKLIRRQIMLSNRRKDYKSKDFIGQEKDYISRINEI